MSYGGHPYGGVGYAGADVAEIPSADTQTTASVEVAFTTGALETPVWVDITDDVRSWDVSRGRSRELERFQPGRATIVLGNLSRQYDAAYDDGPHFGDLRPMRRVRIRETFNGVTYPVFDGFVDRWQLDYPAVGKDATATLTATDLFKVLARTDLGVSVYRNVVADDEPDVWWHLDETVGAIAEGFARNAGTAGSALDGTVNGAPRPGSQSLIAFDPGASYGLQDATEKAGTTEMGAYLPNASLSLLGGSVWTVEAWARTQVTDATDDGFVWSVATNASATTHAGCGKNGTALIFFVRNNGFTTLHGVTTPNDFIVPGQIYHVVCVVESGGQMAMYVNGVRYTTLISGATNTVYPGTRPASGIFAAGHTRADNAVAPPDQAFLNWTGDLDEVAVWDSVALTTTQVSAHYDAGTHPWQGDGPDDRLERVLDLAEIPADLRELTTGNVTLQSAALGATALEHAQKVGETEFGLLFVNRAGVVVLRDRAWQATRSPGSVIYGDGAGEVGYRSIKPDDGDAVIRNSVTISRLNGVAKTATGATIDEFGRFQYTLDGLLHDSDSYSASYAQFIVDEYENPRRRIVELTVGPPKDGEEDLVYPAMLGPELGDAISVTHTPQGLGDPFEITAIIEGIRHSSAPGRQRETTFVLSPEFTQTLF